MLQPSVLGLSLNENTFHFAAYQPDEKGKKLAWIPLEDKLLGSHVIPYGIQIDIKVDGKATYHILIVDSKREIISERFHKSLFQPTVILHHLRFTSGKKDKNRVMPSEVKLMETLRDNCCPSQRFQACVGLTLIEVLIALAIVGIAMTAIIKATSQNIRSTAYLQNKLIAMWVGQQVSNEMLAGITSSSYLIYRISSNNPRSC